MEFVCLNNFSFWRPGGLRAQNRGRNLSVKLVVKGKETVSWARRERRRKKKKPAIVRYMLSGASQDLASQRDASLTLIFSLLAIKYVVEKRNFKKLYTCFSR